MKIILYIYNDFKHMATRQDCYESIDLEQQLNTGDLIALHEGEYATIKERIYYFHNDTLECNAILDQPTTEDVTNLDNQAGKD